MTRHFSPPSLNRPNFGPLGEVVYYRTYSRWIEGQSRRERWNETVERAVDFSLSLDKTMTPQEQQNEGEALYRLIHNLDGFTSGRTLWSGGSAYSYLPEASIANFNCSGSSIYSTDDLFDLVFLLMSGTGGGPRLTSEVVKTFNKNHPVKGRKTGEITYLPYEYQAGGPDDTTITDGMMKVGDSRQGWAGAVSEFVKLYLAGQTDLKLDFNAVRPKGTRLKTFGGYASGPDSLVEGLQEIEKILKEARKRKKVTDIDLADICCLIGRLVVSGGSRRSALLTLGDNPEFAAFKTGEWYKTHPWRSQTNITVVWKEKPTDEQFNTIFDNLLQYGEPGFLNEGAAKSRRSDFRTANPCCEILMDDNGVCNLVELNLKSFVINGYFDLNRAMSAIKLLTRHAVRITLLPLSGMKGKWDEVQQRDRLLGVGLTGIGDMLDATGADEKQFADWLTALRYTVDVEAANYCAKLGVNKPLLSTTIKPSGTLSLLPGVSSGVHAPFSPYYIRRIRISGVDAVAQTLTALGVPVEDDAFNPGTKVFSFPVKSEAKRKASDYSAVEQLERYKAVMKWYVAHNCSITVYMTDEEKEEVIEWMKKNWDTTVAVSFLKKDEGQYPQMPFEAITEEQYLKMVEEFPSLTAIAASLEAFESVSTATDDLDSDCGPGGACPIR